MPAVASGAIYNHGDASSSPDLLGLRVVVLPDWFADAGALRCEGHSLVAQRRYLCRPVHIAIPFLPALVAVPASATLSVILTQKQSEMLGRGVKDLTVIERCDGSVDLSGAESVDCLLNNSPDFGRLSEALLHLKMTGDASLAGIDRFDGLQSLTLEHAQIPSLSQVAALDNLTSLSLERVDAMDGTGLFQLGKLVRLRHLRWRGYRPIPAAALHGIEALPPLESLQLLDIGGASPAELRPLLALRDMESLKHLSLSFLYQRPNDLVSEILHGLNRLEILTVDEISIGGLATLSRHGRLRLLAVTSRYSRFTVDDAWLNALSKVSSLEMLYLAEATDATLVHVAKLTKLRALNIEDTRVTDAGLMQLAALPELKTVFVAGSDVSENGCKAFNERTGREICIAMNFYMGTRLSPVM